MFLRYALTALTFAAAAPHVLPAQDRGAAALGQLVEGLPVSVRVLVIGAHPDDEDTRLITWLALGHHADVAYLSLTRGDGGQNLIGDELGDALGVIRTEELLAARRIDGAHQYFTRAYDFGFSKTSAESFAHWPHDAVLHDVVTVVRAFRPVHAMPGTLDVQLDLTTGIAGFRRLAGDALEPAADTADGAPPVFRLR